MFELIFKFDEWMINNIFQKIVDWFSRKFGWTNFFISRQTCLFSFAIWMLTTYVDITGEINVNDLPNGVKITLYVIILAIITGMYFSIKLIENNKQRQIEERYGLFNKIHRVASVIYIITFSITHVITWLSDKFNFHSFLVAMLFLSVESIHYFRICNDGPGKEERKHKFAFGGA